MSKYSRLPYAHLKGGMIFPSTTPHNREKFWRSSGYTADRDQVMPMTRVDMRDCQLLHRDGDVIAIGTPHGEVVVLEGLSEMKPAKVADSYRDRLTVGIADEVGKKAAAFKFRQETGYIKLFPIGDWIYRLTWFPQARGWWTTGRQPVARDDGERYGHG